MMRGEAVLKTERAGGPYGPPARLRGWAALAAGLLAVFAFVFILAPAMQELESVAPMAEYVRESGINASAFYYTGVDEVDASLVYVRGSFDYTPGETGPDR